MILRGESAILADKLLFATRPLTTEDLDTSEQASRTRVDSYGAPTHGNEGRVDRFEKHLVISDYHIRTYTRREWDVARECYRWVPVKAHDERAMAVVEKFMQVWQPDVVWYNGDFIDAHQVSKFCKSPRDMEGLQEDLDTLQEMFKRHALIVPQAAKHYLLGNHEARLQAYIERNAPGIAGLRVLSDYSVFGAHEKQMQIYSYPMRVPILPGILEICHGDKVAQKSGSTAQKMLEMGVSGVSGHVHRLGTSYRTDRRGMTVWMEGGCLCSLEPDYVQSPNWQSGFTTLLVDRKEARFHMEQHPIINGRTVWAGQVFEAA